MLAGALLLLGGWQRELGAAGPLRACWPRSARVLWAATDFVVTGDPLFSLHYTSTSAEELGRDLPLSELPSAMPEFFAQPRQAAGAASPAVLGLAIAILAVPAARGRAARAARSPGSSRSC